ncbi:MAG: HPr family phosphocarrier protein [Ruminiclostridium sp.]|nr:HPr family phosphocarrier protein [Ruminiclostridium sp.]
MKEFSIRIVTIDDVKKFVSTVMTFDYDIDLISGRYAIDAKSIMGIFSVDLSKDLKLVAHTDDTAELESAIGQFIVK